MVAPAHNLPPMQDVTLAYTHLVPRLCNSLTAAGRGCVVLSGPDGSGKSTIALAAVYELGGDSESMRRRSWARTEELQPPQYGTIVWVRRVRTRKSTKRHDIDRQARNQLYKAISAVLGLQLKSPSHFHLALEEFDLNKHLSNVLFVFDRLLDDVIDAPAPTDARKMRQAPPETMWDHLATLAHHHRVLIITRDASALERYLSPKGILPTHVSLPPFDPSALDELLVALAREEHRLLHQDTLQTVEETARRLLSRERLNLYLLRELYGHAHAGLDVAVEDGSEPDGGPASPKTLVERAISLVWERIDHAYGQKTMTLPLLVLLVLTLFDRDLGPTRGMLQQVLRDHLVPVDTADTALDEALDEALATLCRQRLIARVRTYSRDGVSPPRYVLLPATYEAVPRLISRLPGASQVMNELHERAWEWCLGFTATHGGLDWEGWEEGYRLLRAEWSNVLSILERCHHHGHHGHVCQLWDRWHLQQFSNVAGYWPERLKWLRRIIHQARMAPHSDENQQMLDEARVAIAYTLVYFGLTTATSKAEHILHDVASREGVSSYAYCEAEVTLAMLYVRQHYFDEAEGHLGKLEAYLGVLEQRIRDLDAARQALEAQLPSASGTPLEHLREEIDRVDETITQDRKMKLRWAVELFYYRGIMASERGHWELAWKNFAAMRDLGAKLGYVRANLYATNFLAELALREWHENGLAREHSLLQTVHNHIDRISQRLSEPCYLDVRRYTGVLSTEAFYYFFALKRRGPARVYARRARWRFAVLGMAEELRVVEKLLVRIDELGETGHGAGPSV